MAVPRPKGLGLGADRSMAKQLNSTAQSEEGSKEDEEKLEMKAGTHCQITHGKNTDLYGIV